MAAQTKPKISHFSFALYNRASFTEISRHETGALTEKDKALLEARYYDALVAFYTATIDKQRELLEKDEKTIIEAHINAIYDLESNKEVLACALPSLDGILFGRDVADLRKTRSSERDLRVQQ